MGQPRSQHTSGLIYGLIAYGIWGGFPLYFALLDGVSPIEVVANRVIWSLAFLAVLLTAMRGWRHLRHSLDRLTLIRLALGAVFLSINWGTYVWAVQMNMVVDASLGYFINPLVSVALGVLFLGERLRRNQWLAVILAFIAVLVLTFAMGHPPIVALVLATSFGLYGLFKKQAAIGAVQSLTVETAVLAPLAIMVMAWTQFGGTAVLGHTTWNLTLLLVLLGPVTAIPLIAFGASATRVPLSTLGLLQYVTPIVQFILALTVFGEAMSTWRWIGFVLVWIALAVFTIDTLRGPRGSTDEQLTVAVPD